MNKNSRIRLAMLWLLPNTKYFKILREKSPFSVGICVWIFRENDSFPYVCCLKRTDTYRMNGHWIFGDIASTGLIPVAGFLLAINYGLFFASNGKKWGARD
jgi:hypothetical protein